MTPVLINNQEIGLVFKSGNVVHVDYWAIEEFDFDVNGSAWVFDKSYKQMLTSPKLSRLHLKLNVTKEKMFWTSSRLRNTDSTLEDGRECIKQIVERIDLSFITLNGVDYLIPQKEKFVKINDFERTMNELEQVVFKHDIRNKQDYVTIDVEIPNEN